MKKLTDEELKTWYENLKKQLKEQAEIDLDNEADLGRVFAYVPDTAELDNESKITGKIRYVYAPEEEQDREWGRVYNHLNIAEGSEIDEYPDELGIDMNEVRYFQTKWIKDRIKKDDSIEKIRQLYQLSMQGGLYVTDLEFPIPKSVLTTWDGKIKVMHKPLEKEFGEEMDELDLPEPKEPEHPDNTQEMENYRQEHEKYRYVSRQYQIINAVQATSNILETLVVGECERMSQNEMSGETDENLKGEKRLIETEKRKKYVTEFWKAEHTKEPLPENMQEIHMEIQQFEKKLLQDQEKEKLQKLEEIIQGMVNKNFFLDILRIKNINSINAMRTLQNLMTDMSGYQKSTSEEHENKKKLLEETLQDFLPQLQGAEVTKEGDKKSLQYRCMYEQWKLILNESKDVLSLETKQKIEQYITEENKKEKEKFETPEAKAENARIKQAAEDTLSRWERPKKVELTDEVRQKIDDAWKQVKDNSILFRGSKEYKEMYAAMEKLHKAAEKGESGEELAKQLKTVQLRSWSYLRKKSDSEFYDPHAEKTLATKGVGENRYKAAQKAFNLLNDIENQGVKEQVKQEPKEQVKQDQKENSKEPLKKDEYEIMQEKFADFNKFFTRNHVPYNKVGGANADKVEPLITLSCYISESVNGKKQKGHIQQIEELFLEPYNKTKTGEQIEQVRNEFYKSQVVYRPYNVFLDASETVNIIFNGKKTLDAGAAVWGKIAGKLKEGTPGFFEGFSAHYGKEQAKEIEKALISRLGAIEQIGEVSENRMKLMSEFQKSSSSRLTREQAVDLVAASYLDMQIRVRNMQDIIKLTEKMNGKDGKPKTSWREIFEDSPVVDNLMQLDDRKKIMEYIRMPEKQRELALEVADDFAAKKIVKEKGEQMQPQKQEQKKRESVRTK